MAKKLKTASKVGQGVPLHQWIAVGNSPKDYETCKGVNEKTLPGYKKKK